MHFEQTIELGIVHQERSTGVHVQGNRRILQRRGLEWDLEPPKHLQRQRVRTGSQRGACRSLLQTATLVDSTAASNRPCGTQWRSAYALA